MHSCNYELRRRTKWSIHSQWDVSKQRCSALGSIYARKDTVGVIDTCLSHPTLPVHMPEKKLDAELSLGRFLNRLGSNEIRPYFHQSPICDGLFFAGLSDGDSYTDFEIGLEAADRARDFLLQSEKMLGTVILDCSVQRKADRKTSLGIAVDQQHLLSFLRQSDTKIRTGSCFTDASFLIRYCDYLCRQ